MRRSDHAGIGSLLLTPFEERSSLAGTEIDASWVYLGSLSLPSAEGTLFQDVYLKPRPKTLGCVHPDGVEYVAFPLWLRHTHTSWVRAALLYLASRGAELLDPDTPCANQPKETSR